MTFTPNPLFRTGPQPSPEDYRAAESFVAAMYAAEKYPAWFVERHRARDVAAMAVAEMQRREAAEFRARREGKMEKAA